ncbi:GspH/FimT family pseudopilin [Thermodesulfobacteriota bacterium]
MSCISRCELTRYHTFDNNSGFSLLDLTLVLMIIGILGMIVLPTLNNLISQTKVNAAAGELVSGLEYARSLAVEYRKPFGLRVDGNQFKIFDDAYKSDPNPHHTAQPPVDAYGVVVNPVDKKWYIKDFDAMENYNGVDITSVPSGGEIRFFPDGHCSDPAGSANTFVLDDDGGQITISVDGTTGRVSVL